MLRHAQPLSAQCVRPLLHPRPPRYNTSTGAQPSKGARKERTYARQWAHLFRFAPSKNLRINRHPTKACEELRNSPDRSETETKLAKILERHASHKHSRNAAGKVDRLGGVITSPLGANSVSRKYHFRAVSKYDGALGRFDGWRQVTRDFSQESKQRSHDEVRIAPRPLDNRVPQPPSSVTLFVMSVATSISRRISTTAAWPLVTAR